MSWSKKELKAKKYSKYDMNFLSIFIEGPEEAHLA